MGDQMEEGQKRNGRVLTKFELDDIEFAAISQVGQQLILLTVSLCAYKDLAENSQQRSQFVAQMGIATSKCSEESDNANNFCKALSLKGLANLKAFKAQAPLNKVLKALKRQRLLS